MAKLHRYFWSFPQSFWCFFLKIENSRLTSNYFSSKGEVKSNFIFHISYFVCHSVYFWIVELNWMDHLKRWRHIRHNHVHLRPNHFDPCECFQRKIQKVELTYWQHKSCVSATVAVVHYSSIFSSSNDSSTKYINQFVREKFDHCQYKKNM